MNSSNDTFFLFRSINLDVEYNDDGTEKKLTSLAGFCFPAATWQICTKVKIMRELAKASRVNEAIKAATPAGYHIRFAEFWTKEGELEVVLVYSIKGENLTSVWAWHLADDGSIKPLPAARLQGGVARAVES